MQSCVCVCVCVYGGHFCVYVWEGTGAGMKGAHKVSFTGTVYI